MSPDLRVTREQFVDLRALAHELSADSWSESKWLEGVKRILGRDDLECEHEYSKTFAGVTIKIVEKKKGEA